MLLNGGANCLAAQSAEARSKRGFPIEEDLIETQCKESRYFSEWLDAVSHSEQHEDNLTDLVEGPFNRILWVIENPLYEPSEKDSIQSANISRIRSHARGQEKGYLERLSDKRVKWPEVASDRLRLRQLAAALSIKFGRPIDLGSLHGVLVKVADSGAAELKLQNHFVTSISITAKSITDHLHPGQVAPDALFFIWHKTQNHFLCDQPPYQPFRVLEVVLATSRSPVGKCLFQMQARAAPTPAIPIAGTVPLIPLPLLRRPE